MDRTSIYPVKLIINDKTFTQLQTLLYQWKVRPHWNQGSEGIKGPSDVPLIKVA